ncbi:hypothetical protein [uncultured Lamprocystis sp.]|jgi:hypothetical protein|uniref:hypothetical protein n=1 Tax=uncultured Lamprocystis sp. TaxID=543132 RepID=UPI0025F963D8|nr:hypothetical protein [uncultured Lamprocystis sp.]
MWVFLSDAFLSIVAHRDRPDDLLVRARIAGDLERVFPGYPVEITPDADYRFRAVIPRTQVAQALADQATTIDYRNFKGSVRDSDRHDAYMQVWHVMRQAQKSGSRTAK